MYYRPDCLTGINSGRRPWGGGGGGGGGATTQTVGPWAARTWTRLPPAAARWGRRRAGRCVATVTPRSPDPTRTWAWSRLGRQMCTTGSALDTNKPTTQLFERTPSTPRTTAERKDAGLGTYHGRRMRQAGAPGGTWSATAGRNGEEGGECDCRHRRRGDHTDSVRCGCSNGDSSRRRSPHAPALSMLPSWAVRGARRSQGWYGYHGKLHRAVPPAVDGQRGAQEVGWWPSVAPTPADGGPLGVRMGDACQATGDCHGGSAARRSTAAVDRKGGAGDHRPSRLLADCLIARLNTPRPYGKNFLDIQPP